MSANWHRYAATRRPIFLRHLSLLAFSKAWSAELSQGNSVYYRIADAAVYELCDVVCGNIVTHLQKQQEEQQNLLAEVSGHR